MLVLLVPTATIEQGMFNIDGYASYGGISACVLFIAIMISAVGTHSYIPRLREPPAKRNLTLRRIFSEIFETLANRSFLALFLAALCGAVASGVSASLSYYLNIFFWGFSSEQIGYISASVVLSAIIALMISPIVSRRLGKKRGAIIIGIFAFTIAPLPVALRLLGLIPENGDPLLFPLVCGMIIFDVGLIIAFQTLSASMIADVVEQSELQTGRRSEGVFFAAITFSRKVVQGFGVLAATIILTVIEFPEGAQPGEVTAQQVYDLGLFYAPTVFGLWMLMIFCLKLYRIDRSTHEDNLRALGRSD